MSQSQRNKKAGQNTSGKPSGKSTASVQPQKSRGPFFALLLVIVIAGAAGIAYKVSSAPKPIVLAQGATLPKSEGYFIGKPEAPITIMEFADFECPRCAEFSNITEPDVRTRIIDAGLANMRFYDFPMEDMHPNTLFASLAASCAADQDKFWPMHDAILTNQISWEARATKNPTKEFDKYAKSIGLDMGKYSTCMEKRDNVPRIQAHQATGASYMVKATPSFVINGVLYEGALSYDRIKAIVDMELAKIQLPAGANKQNADSKKPPAK